MNKFEVILKEFILTYNEKLAEEVYRDLPDALKYFRVLLFAVESSEGRRLS